ncbi:MAG: hypothetical protein KGI14_09465 [Acidobacteriota bacterium]|nr:hypothetical protein [Acidobacteriota bacterium]
MELRSVDTPRERPAPAGFRGRDAAGVEVSRTFTRATVVVAVKPHCDGCREFVSGEAWVGDVDLVVAAAAEDDSWRDSGVVIAPELWRDLEIRSAPFFALIDPARGVVTYEGSAFSAAQVAGEIASRLGASDSPS